MMKHISKIFVVILFLSTVSLPLLGNEVTTASPSAPISRIVIKNDESRPWWLGDLLTFLSIIAGALLIIFQIGKQHRNQINAQKENNREQLRLEVYQEFSKVYEDANEKTSDVGMYVFTLITNMQIYLDQKQMGIDSGPLTGRVLEFFRRNGDASKSVIDLIYLIEKYEIVCPELEIFKTAFCASSYDMMKAFNPLHSYMLAIYPIEIIDKDGASRLENIKIPTNQQFIKLKELCDNYKNSQDDLGGYLMDFNAELQEIFLSNLFNNKVKRREPIDPSVKVITTKKNDIEILNKYFRNETEWGKSAKEAEDYNRKIYNNP